MGFISNLIDLIRGKPNQISDVKISVGEQKKPTEAEIKKIVSKERYLRKPTLGYTTTAAGVSRSSGDFRGPIHDLGEVARAVDVESFLARSIQKHREYIL